MGLTSPWSAWASFFPATRWSRSIAPPTLRHGPHTEGDTRWADLNPTRAHEQSALVDDQRHACQPKMEVRRPALPNAAHFHEVEADGVGQRQVLIREPAE